MSDLTTVLGLLAVGAACGWVYVAFQRDLRASRERLQGRSRIVVTPCGPIEYAETGSGPAVLVVHGAGGGFDQGMEFGRALVDRGFRVISMSRFGYLQTPMPTDASPVAQADGHLALMDALGIRRAAAIGASAGAPSAMQLAIRHPERCQALVLLVPMAYRPTELVSSVSPISPTMEKILMAIVSSDFSFWLATKLAPNMVIRLVLATPPKVLASATVDERARAQRVMSDIQPISRRGLGILNDARISSSLPRLDLEKIYARTLVLSVRDDLYGTFTSAQYTAQQIPGAKFVGYDVGGHLWVGHHAEVIAEISAFLEPHSATAGDLARDRIDQAVNS
jgi:2-hydroxy-6-oxonona-2,4-dienedioate hydrolase